MPRMPTHGRRIDKALIQFIISLYRRIHCSVQNKSFFCTEQIFVLYSEVIITLYRIGKAGKQLSLLAENIETVISKRIKWK